MNLVEFMGMRPIEFYAQFRFKSGWCHWYRMILNVLMKIEPIHPQVLPNGFFHLCYALAAAKWRWIFTRCRHVSHFWLVVCVPSQNRLSTVTRIHVKWFVLFWTHQHTQVHYTNDILNGTIMQLKREGAQFRNWHIVNDIRCLYECGNDCERNEKSTP